MTNDLSLETFVLGPDIVMLMNDRQREERTRQPESLYNMNNVISKAAMKVTVHSKTLCISKDQEQTRNNQSLLISNRRKLLCM